MRGTFITGRLIVANLEGKQFTLRLGGDVADKAGTCNISRDVLFDTLGSTNSKWPRVFFADPTDANAAVPQSVRLARYARTTALIRIALMPGSFTSKRLHVGKTSLPPTALPATAAVSNWAKTGEAGLRTNIGNVVA